MAHLSYESITFAVTEQTADPLPILSREQIPKRGLEQIRSLYSEPLIG